MKLQEVEIKEGGLWCTVDLGRQPKDLTEETQHRQAFVHAPCFEASIIGRTAFVRLEPPREPHPCCVFCYVEDWLKTVEI